MHVLLLNTYDLKGGAAKATWRLFKGLQEAGIRIQMLVQNKTSIDPDVYTTQGLFHNYFNGIRPYIDFAIPFPLIRSRILFSTAFIPDQVQQAIDQVNPDLVHLNWIAGGMIRIESLSLIRQPIVWTFHDLWAFTGGCHYPPAGCDRYKEHCGQCPVLHSGSNNDLSRKVFDRKEHVYSSIKNLTIITPSQWLAEKVRESPLLHGRHVEVIANGLETSIFKPVDKLMARKRFNLPADKTLILFGGIRGVQNEIKGFKLLCDALEGIRDIDFELVVFGSSASKKTKTLPFPSNFLGFIRDEAVLADLYSAADVVVVPSQQEVFGQTASEALSCGVPVVAFATSGLLDIVDHKENGYLAECFKPDDLANGIKWVLQDGDRYRALSEAARTKALMKFDLRITTQNVLNLYARASGRNPDSEYQLIDDV
jgi:glycosyltransferase involved in cell wall biosynthesis